MFNRRSRLSPSSLSIPSPKVWLSGLPTSLFSFPRKISRTGQAEHAENERNEAQDPDFKLPKLTSLVIVLLTSGLLQVSFFIIVSSSNAYAEHLGGTSTFSGLVIGIPTVFSGIALLPLMKIDRGGYKRPLHFACGSAVLGHILYGLAYKANFLYLILISRIVSGLGFTFWMYSKRYCSDGRIVGVRRRTTLAGWLVVGQATGFSLGPFLGGVLYKVGFSNDIFNGYTSPAWIMAGVWAIFWAFAAALFEDVPQTAENEVTEMDTMNTLPAGREGAVDGLSKSDEDVQVVERRVLPETAANAGADAESSIESPPQRTLSTAQWSATAVMCWFAMTCFFILGAWESNIPVFTGSSSPLSPFHFNPFAAGNLIALGGACTFPFLFMNVFIARRYQDRNILGLGISIGFAGLAIALAILGTKTVHYASLFMCWFLVALGFNLASTVTLSLLSKQLPDHWNTRTSLAIQYSNYMGRVTGAVWGGAGVKVGMLNYVGMQMGIVGVGIVMVVYLWRHLKAKTG